MSAFRHLLITALYISREHFSWGGWLSCFSIWKRLLLSGSSVSPPPLPPLFGSSLFLFGSRILVMLGGSMIESWFRRLFVLRSLKSSQVRLGTQYLPVLKKLFTASPSAYVIFAGRCLSIAAVFSLKICSFSIIHSLNSAKAW